MLSESVLSEVCLRAICVSDASCSLICLIAMEQAYYLCACHHPELCWPPRSPPKTSSKLYDLPYAAAGAEAEPDEDEGSDLAPLLSGSAGRRAEVGSAALSCSADWRPA